MGTHRYLTPSVLIIFFLLIFFREPAYFINPRIWAEEGSIYIQSYLNSGLSGSFFSPHMGYYSLFNKIAVSISMGTLGLQFAAAGTTAFSFLIMCAALLSPFILPSRYWDTEIKKNAIVLYSLILGTGEIWLNTINSQFYLGLFSVYILLSETNELRSWRLVYCLSVLILAALTGVTSVILLPFFALKLFSGGRLQLFSTSRVNWIFFAVLIFGLIIQVLAFLYSLNHGGYGHRFDIHFLANMPKSFVASLLWGFHDMWSTGVGKMIIVILSEIFMVYFLYSAIKNGHTTRYLTILIAYISLVLTLLSLGMFGGARYAYPASVLIVILLLQQATCNEKLFLKRAALSALTAIALIKTPSFFYTKMYYNSSWDSYHSQSNRAISGEQDYINIHPQWPGTNWRIILSRSPDRNN